MLLIKRSDELRPGLQIRRGGADVGFDQYELAIGDEASSFRCLTYLDIASLQSLIHTLMDFPSVIPASKVEFEIGPFHQRRAAGGAIHARLSVNGRRVLFSARAHSEFFQFGDELVATEGCIYALTEPVLIDNFIHDLGRLAARETDEACLATLPHWACLANA